MLSLSLCSKSLFSQQERKTRVALGGHLSKLLKFLVDFFKMLKTLLLRIIVLDIFDYHDRPRQVTILPFPNYAKLKLHLWIRKVFAAQLLLNSDPFERELHRRQSTIVLWS